MTNPRWTVDGEYRTEAGDLLAWVCSTNPFDPEPAAALVAAVRDADTLRQARALADELTFDNGEASWQDLLDLLVPDVPATPTPQGQT